MKSLKESFRLFYGEGTGKKVEADFRLFRLGYECGISDATKVAENYLVTNKIYAGVSNAIRELVKEKP